MTKQDGKPSVYVPCVNGAYYENPILVGKGGFVEFPYIDPENRAILGPLAIVNAWDRGEDTATRESVLDACLGDGAWKNVAELGVQMREIPTDPEPRREMLMHGASFCLAARIPEPQLSDSDHRYKSRLRGVQIVEPEKKPALD